MPTPGEEAEEEDSPLLNHEADDAHHHHSWRSRCRVYLSSRQKHYAVMTLVALDVLAILIDIFITLVTCELGPPEKEHEAPVETVHEVIKVSGLVFSALFLAELIATLWAFGFTYSSPLLSLVLSTSFPL